MERRESLGRYMKQLRIDAGLSLMEVANRSGLGYTHLSRVENDSVVPNPATIARIAEVLDGDVAVMLRLADNLPALILDRLSDRARRDPAAALHRAIPGSDSATPKTDSLSLDALVKQAELSNEEESEMLEAVQGLLRLSPSRRRLLVDLISSYFPEGDDPTG